MRRFVAIVVAGMLFGSSAAFAGEVEIRAAQSSIEAQINAFLAGDDETAYSYAAPGIKRIFPTLERFMTMVKGAYQPVWKPRSFSFGRSKELSPTSIVQEVLVVGPDGRNYEAIYTLELQPDGTFRITGVSLREARIVGAWAGTLLQSGGRSPLSQPSVIAAARSTNRPASIAARMSAMRLW